MAIKVRVKAKEKDGVAEVKALLKHPMESGVRMNKKTGKPYPAHYVTNIDVSVNGTKTVAGQMSGAVSQNPYVALHVNASKGDEVTVSVTDNQGDTGEKTVKIK